MSFRPLSLAVFFPPELQQELQKTGSQPFGVDQETTPSASHRMHLRTTSHELDSTVDFLTHAHSLSSTARTHKENSSDTWNDTEPFKGEEEKEEEYWGENEEEDTDGEYEYEQEDASGPLQHVWISDEERQRVAYKRARASAERVDLDQSPFFPNTVADYVGLKAAMLEARAARLRAKMQERERALRAGVNARWKRVFVVGYSGETEETVIPVYYEDREEGGRIAPAQPSSTVGNGKIAVQLEQTSNTDFGSGPFCPPGPVVTGINNSDPWSQGPYFPGPVTTANINANYHWVPAYYCPDNSFNTTDDWPRLCYVACPVTPHSTALYAGDHALWGAVSFQTDHENSPRPWVDAVWFGPQANDAVNYNHGFQLPPTSAAGHQRARSASILRGIAAHAAIRRGVEQHGLDSAPINQGRFEEGGYDSDSSFTPSDYRPQANSSKGEARRKILYGRCNSSFPDSFIPPNNYTTQPVDSGEHGDNGKDKVDAHLDEHNGHDENENGQSGSGRSRLSSSDCKLDKFKLYKTLDGKMEAKGKEKSDEYVQNGPAHVHKEHGSTKKDEGSPKRVEGSTKKTKGKTATESNGTQSGGTKPEANPPCLPHPAAAQPSTRPLATPSEASTSTFTPSDYDPRKVRGSERVKPKHTPLASLPTPFSPPPPPPSVPALATLPLSARDNLSPVFAHTNNPFTQGDKKEMPECDWPTVAELTTEGEGRVKRWGTTTTGPSPDLATGGTTTGLELGLGLGLGRFLPVPRLRDVVDPRLGFAPQEVEALIKENGGTVPWEVRLMAGERRWDLHGERRIWEVWGVRFEDEEEGWDWFDLEGGAEVGVGMARGLLLGGREDGFESFGERVMVGEEGQREERGEDKGGE